MTANNRPTDCVCNCSGHCAACLSAGIVCDRLGCKATRSDGKPCPGRVPPPPPSGARRAPAMPEPELVDEDRAPELHDDCARALAKHDAVPAIDVEAALRASLARSDAPKPDAMLTPRERAARRARHEDRAQLARLRASTESYPARALTLDDLDAHERPRCSVMRSRA